MLKKNGRKSAWNVFYIKKLWLTEFLCGLVILLKQKLDDIKSRFSSKWVLVHKFAQEYMNEARDLETAKFKIDRINKYRGHIRRKKRI